MVRYQAYQSILHALVLIADRHCIVVSTVANDDNHNELDKCQVRPCLSIKILKDRLQKFANNVNIVTWELKRDSCAKKREYIEVKLVDHLLVDLLFIFLRNLVLCNLNFNFFDKNLFIRFTYIDFFLLWTDLINIALTWLYIAPCKVVDFLPLLCERTWFHEAQEFVESFHTLKLDLNG